MTVADLFKYRNKVGLDVALEALEQGWLTIDEPRQAARVCRMQRVIQPFVAMLP